MRASLSVSSRTRLGTGGGGATTIGGLPLTGGGGGGGGGGSGSWSTRWSSSRTIHDIFSSKVAVGPVGVGGGAIGALAHAEHISASASTSVERVTAR